MPSFMSTFSFARDTSPISHPLRTTLGICNKNAIFNHLCAVHFNTDALLPFIQYSFTPKNDVLHKVNKVLCQSQ